MNDIDNLMQKFCDAGACAMRRYAEVAGEGPGVMPEYFMPAVIFDRMGDGIYATLETVFSKLLKWNNELRALQDLPPRADQIELLALAEELSQTRVDMVLAERLAEGWAFIALVEFKRGSISPDDRAKLLHILPHVETCPYGVACAGWVPGGENLVRHQNEAQNAGDRWYQSRMDPLQTSDEPYFFCARLFGNPGVA
jgi:hypothetical protein